MQNPLVVNWEFSDFGSKHEKIPFSALKLQNPVGKVLEIVVEPCGQRILALLDHTVDQRVQLLLGVAQVEPVAQGSNHRRTASKAGQLRT